MMHGFEKSDRAIVAMKSTNKDLSGPAESMERRAGAKGNPSGQSTRRAQERGSVSQAVERIRQAAKRNPKQKLVSLLHHISVDALHEAYLSLKRKAASGVDGVTWSTYADGLMDRLSDLHDRVHSGAYRALPSRRVYIPKADGSKRPLGIAALEDKIVQKALPDVILVPIYETEFLGFSYGFRPQRSAHDALDALAVGIARRKVNWILDADIRGFFDTVHRDWLIRFLEHRIGDKRVIRLIIKWLNAGVMEEGQWSDTGKGTPQGAIVSPVLANIYLHYVFDLWTKVWRSKRAVGDVIVVRYADDFVVGFQHRAEAEQYLADLERRLAEFGLALHPTKTRLIEFGRFAVKDRKRRGLGKPETFDFLGMTHYCTVTRKGWFRLGRKPARKRVTRTIRRLWEALRKRWHVDKHENARWLGRVLRGWLTYYAVPGSFRYLNAFVYIVKRLFLRALRRRAQKDRTSWEAVDQLSKRYWPKVRILHPWPSQRLVV